MFFKYIFFIFFFILLIGTTQCLRTRNHYDDDGSGSNSCTEEYCKSNYDLYKYEDPFKPKCKDDDAKCFRQFYGFPDCQDKDISCWQKASGYPQNCSDDDYDCWLDYYGYSKCQDIPCIKQYLNISCKYDDLNCWKTKVSQPQCQWNNWDCWVQYYHFDWFCDGKKGFECIDSLSKGQCKKDDEKCWKKSFNIPDSECQKNITCYKQFFYLTDCKDDDLNCWKDQIYGPKCKKGDFKCLKQFLWVPSCQNQDDQAKCYKKWLNYPDCAKDDAKCWKNQQGQSGLYYSMILSHKSETLPREHHFLRSIKTHKSYQIPKMKHTKNFGLFMEHKRAELLTYHKMKNTFGKTIA